MAVRVGAGTGAAPGALLVPWHEELERLIRSNTPSVSALPLAQLSRHTHAVACTLYSSLALDMPPSVHARLREREREALAYVSATPEREPGAPGADPRVATRFTDGGETGGVSR